MSARGAGAWLRGRVTVPRRLRDALAQFVSTDLMTSIMTDPKYAALWERCGFRVTRDGDYYKPFPSSRTVHGMNLGPAVRVGWYCPEHPVAVHVPAARSRVPARVCVS